MAYVGGAQTHFRRAESVRLGRLGAYGGRRDRCLLARSASSSLELDRQSKHAHLTIKDDDDAFIWAKEWFLDQKFLKRVRNLDLDTTLRGENVALVPAPGHHWFWHCGRPLEVFFYRSQETKGWSPKQIEVLTFRTIGRQQDFMKSFVDEIVDSHQKRVRERSHLYTYNEHWIRSFGYNPRWIGSVILPAGEKERLIADVANFKASRERYQKLGVPYHRGYLLYGPPGTGKTSLVSALADRFGMSVYAMNLTALMDRSLVIAMNTVPQNSVVLFEDIDCMKPGKARSNKNDAAQERNPAEEKKENDSLGVTLSGLLNVLDGFHAPDGVLFVMTSNHIEALDPALLRPGRIDYRLFLGPATDEQKIELYRRFFPGQPEVEAAAFVQFHAAVQTMAEFQGLLLKHEAAPEEIPFEPNVKSGITESETLEEAVIR